MSVMCFRDLIQTHYVAKGIGLFAAKMTVCRESGVSMSALRNAYDGTRVAPETANTLIVWARERHGVTLGYAELTAAPTRPPVDWGKRLETAMMAVANAVGLPEGKTLRVEYTAGADEPWHVTARDAYGTTYSAHGGDGALSAFMAEFSKRPANDNGERPAKDAAEG